MKTGKLTPRSNNTVAEMRFTGSFGQPDGFGSVLTIQIKKDGRACFTLEFKDDLANQERIWSVDLDNEQRKMAATFLKSYEPVLWETVGKDNES